MNIKPTPTEYRGIVFKSKSEAVFARTLDLSLDVSNWLYEPVSETNHPWDFLVFVSKDARCSYCCSDYKSYQQVLVEYKPSEPTQTYLTNLIEKTRPIVEAFEKEAKRGAFDSYVVYGNPWKGPQPNRRCSYICYPVFSNFAEYGWGDFCQAGDNGENYLYSSMHDMYEVFGITEDMVQEAMKFRFDLISLI